MPFLLFSFFLFFLLINQKNNIESKRTNISKLKAFIVSPQKSKNKIIILNNKNSSIINNKVIKKNIQRNIFLKENIRGVLTNKSVFKLNLFASSYVSPIINFFLSNKGSIKLASLHFIRIYKFIIYIRCLLEWLPQINPHLNPFVFIFTFTNNYVQFFHKIIPNVFGIDLSGIFSWLFLEMIENYLST
ncbi:apicoplast conserved ycf19 protein precursor, unknown function [Plasmodium reichenowi]|uniref:YGGT family protein, putative n=6 Tax=Plasmodium (Laverania) TaxID=418107 RepID=C0H470_PLAF7|nr:YGGT family protein, putative [Plasmodium falciparum 3D7]ETW20593.1 hypothetical protein PFFVO_00504 [Plasmodium falciparum Vietnam Oak-Knoll (FVO)]ETW45214.1 hypothetical protein PFNF135_00542 [Plasmodium falciparum NF135/5.C10]ETW52194.1 hypothetical protein PFUGPA_05809 [Plasmodium falciparum Palo Alto/Uganda]KAF4328800.1 apicoplast conserved ycf19 protein precursor [Plasmodium falciparum NF54]CDO62557.1 apicoplast conserved ycf19 protein precursor, unknown function [Plasmodium reichenow|eukprot:XP_002808620.1 apicoplast conserved ycf19 protein precursor,unknown function [Plasmodium falciparum 3D7]